MIASPPQNDIAAIVYHIDATRSDFLRQHIDVASASAFWTRERHFRRLTESTHRAKTFEQGWDGYEAVTPNDTSVARTLEVLSKVRDSKLTPYSVLPSADGGIGVSFRGNANKRAVLELLNDGTSSYTLYGKGHATESSEFDSKAELVRVIQRFEEYL